MSIMDPLRGTLREGFVYDSSARGDIAQVRNASCNNKFALPTSPVCFSDLYLDAGDFN